MLSQENLELVRRLVAEAGERLQGKLPPLPDIPNRNGYAHIWREIKQAFGHTYKECDDSDVPRIISIIERAETMGMIEYDTWRNSST